jgi:hypothetical protein
MTVEPAPPDLARTREALHAVAERVLAPARVQATGNEIALEATPGGFGTPAFPDGGLVRVQGAALVVIDTSGGERSAPLTTLRAAGELAGLDAQLPDDELDVDPAAADFLGAFYAFAWEALERLRAGADDPSPTHLWPEHFDVAFDAGDEAAGTRATYGASPGDERHPEPYLYVAPWTAPEPGALWNATGFTGAELGWQSLAAERDPAALAQGFWTAVRDALAVGSALH